MGTLGGVASSDRPPSRHGERAGHRLPSGLPATIAGAAGHSAVPSPSHFTRRLREGGRTVGRSEAVRAGGRRDGERDAGSADEHAAGEPRGEVERHRGPRGPPVGVMKAESYAVTRAPEPSPAPATMSSGPSEFRS